MPGKGNRCSWQLASDQVGDQGSQARRVNGFAGRSKFGLSPPAMATVVPALELVQPSGVYLVTGDAMEEEVVAEQSAGPPQVGAAGRVRDRVQVSGCDGEPGLLAQLPRRGFRETFAFFDAAAGNKPGVARLDEQQPVRSIKQQYTCRPTRELRHGANSKACRRGRRSYMSPAKAS
jgi:hypothetical protein